VRTLLVDNHDSYTYNVFHLLAGVSGEDGMRHAGRDAPDATGTKRSLLFPDAGRDRALDHDSELLVHVLVLGERSAPARSRPRRA